MWFRSVFIAVTIAFALILGAFLVTRARPKAEIQQPTADFVRASGKCAECHACLQYSVVHEYEMSAHAKHGVNCLDCHQPAPGQQKQEHHGFVISAHLTAGNCRSCHEPIYEEFLRSVAPLAAGRADAGGIGDAPRPCDENSAVDRSACAASRMKIEEGARIGRDRRQVGAASPRSRLAS